MITIVMMMMVMRRGRRERFKMAHCKIIMTMMVIAHSKWHRSGTARPCWQIYHLFLPGCLFLEEKKRGENENYNDDDGNDREDDDDDECDKGDDSNDDERKIV